MVVDPSQLLGTVITPFAKLHKFSIRRLKFDVGLLEKFSVLGNLEIEALTLFSIVLDSLFKVGLVLRFQFLHLCFELGDLIILGSEEGKLIVFLFELGLMLPCLFEKMQHHIRHGHTIFQRY